MVSQIINFSLDRFVPSGDCINWCKEQHFEHFNYMANDGLTILMIAGFVVVANYLWLAFADRFSSGDEYKQKVVTWVSMASNILLFCLIIGYLIYIKRFLP